MTTPQATQPDPIDWQNLIQAGDDLLNPQGVSHPTAEHIRRAISNAYYAMFHALAASNADVLIGPPDDELTAAAWTRVYRGLDHNRAKREFRDHREKLSVEGQNFAGFFNDLQARRHSADYDPNAVFNVQDTRIWLAIAGYVCAAYLQAEQSERACIAALTTIDRRRD